MWLPIYPAPPVTSIVSTSPFTLDPFKYAWFWSWQSCDKVTISLSSCLIYLPLSSWSKRCSYFFVRVDKAEKKLFFWRTLEFDGWGGAPAKAEERALSHERRRISGGHLRRWRGRNLSESKKWLSNVARSRSARCKHSTNGSTANSQNRRERITVRSEADLRDFSLLP